MLRVLQVLLEEIFQKIVSQNKDRTVLFPMLIFFRNIGRQGNGGKGFESFVSAGTSFQCISLEHGTVVWLEFLCFLCAGITFHAHGSHCFNHPMPCTQNPNIICIPTGQRKGHNACAALFIPLVEACSKAEIGALFCVWCLSDFIGKRRIVDNK